MNQIIILFPKLIATMIFTSWVSRFFHNKSQNVYFNNWQCVWNPLICLCIRRADACVCGSTAIDMNADTNIDMSEWHHHEVISCHGQVQLHHHRIRSAMFSQLKLCIVSFRVAHSILFVAFNPNCVINTIWFRFDINVLAKREYDNKRNRDRHTHAIREHKPYR